MNRKMKRPIIETKAYFEGNCSIYEAFGKVYAQIYKDNKSAHLQSTDKPNKLKSS